MSASPRLIARKALPILCTPELQAHELLFTKPLAPISFEASFANKLGLNTLNISGSIVVLEEFEYSYSKAPPS